MVPSGPTKVQDPESAAARVGSQVAALGDTPIKHVALVKYLRIPVCTRLFTNMVVPTGRLNTFSAQCLSLSSLL